ALADAEAAAVGVAGLSVELCVGLGLTLAAVADGAGDAWWDGAPGALPDFSGGPADVLAILAAVSVPAGAVDRMPAGADGWASANAGVAGQPTAARVIAASRLAAKSAHLGVLLLRR